MKHIRNSLIAFLAILSLVCCSVKNKQSISHTETTMTLQEERLVDSILQFGLDNEALFTLMGDIKPLSSLTVYYYPVANTDSTKLIGGNFLSRDKDGKYLDKMYRIQQAVNKIKIPDLEFVVVPYVNPSKDKRVIQVSVIRKSSLDKKLKEKENFYGQLGLVPGINPGIALAIIEASSDFERWRGYGYLFGYPDHAVDFYNKSSDVNKKTGKQLARNFFRIPTYNADHSNFVYAYAKDHALNPKEDSVLYYKAADVLKTYKGLRDKYTNPDGSVQSYKLLKDYYNNQK